MNQFVLRETAGKGIKQCFRRLSKRACVIKATFLKSIEKHSCKLALVLLSSFILSACSTSYVVEYIEEEGSNSGTWVRVNDGEQTKINANLNGQVILNTAETDIDVFPADSELSISTQGEDHFSMHIERKGSAPVKVSYQLNGEAVNRAAVSEQQLQLAWQSFFRLSGHSADERATRIVKNGGLSALLNEIEMIQSNLVTRRYIEHLVTSYALSDQEITETIAIIQNMSSNSQSSEAFSALLSGKTALRETQVIALVEATDNITSNNALSTLLIDIINKPAHNQLSPALADSVLEAAKNISSNNSLGDVLSQLLDKVDDQQIVAKLIKQAGRNISSNNRLASLYTQTLDKDLGQDNMRLLLKSAGDNISSSNGLADFVINAIKSDNFSAEIIDDVTRVTKQIASSSRQSDVMELLNSLK